MSVVCAVKSNFGSIAVSAKQMTNSNKLYPVNQSVIGIVGWHAISAMVEHLITTEKKLFKLDNRLEIFSTLLTLHEKMKDDYFIETKENDDQPVESNQLDALIINKHGLFQIGSYREVNEYNTFWAIGSGKRFALGAMHALYGTKATAKNIAEAGVKAAAEYDDGCSLPMNTKILKINN